jgi:hypothetical protein
MFLSGGAQINTVRSFRRSFRDKEFPEEFPGQGVSGTGVSGTRSFRDRGVSEEFPGQRSFRDRRSNRHRNAYLPSVLERKKGSNVFVVILSLPLNNDDARKIPSVAIAPQRAFPSLKTSA